jgi:hypothetical protein
MTTVKKLSEYRENGRTATVYKNTEEDHFYLVSVTNDSGSSFRAIYENEGFAEDFAKRWVEKNE